MIAHISRRRLLAALLAGAAGAPAQAQYKASPWPADRTLPALAAADLQGKLWDLATLRGRAVLLNFWATWCAPCKEELPTLQTLADLEIDRLTVLAIDTREPARRARRYLQSTGLNLTVLPDPQGDIARAWGVTVFPTTVLIDPAGHARQVVRGAVDWTGQQAAGWIRALRS